MAMIDRGTYWQCAYVIHKGGMEEIRAARARSVPRRVSPRSRPIFAGRLERDWPAGTTSSC